MFYTDRKNYASERSEFINQTQMNLLGGLSQKILICFLHAWKYLVIFTHEKIAIAMDTY